MRQAGMLRDERGQALPLIALLMTALVAMIYIAYGLGKLVNARIQFQNAADSAALAATAMKANVHNIRTQAYTAMSFDAINARANAYAGLIALAQIVAGGDIDPKDKAAQQAADGDLASLQEQYKKFSDQALRYTLKLQQEAAVLDAFNKWAAETLPTAARQAAQIGYLANIQGVNDRDAEGTSAQAHNLSLLASDGDLPENDSSFAGGKFLPGAGINIEAESARLSGVSGMSYVKLEPRLGSNETSMSLLQELEYRIVRTEALAHLAASDDLDPNDLASIGLVQFKWYSPRLRSLDQQG